MSKLFFFFFLIFLMVCVSSCDNYIGDPENLYNKSMELIESGNLERAADSLEVYCKNFQDDYAYALLGDIYTEIGNFKKAKKVYKKLLKRDIPFQKPSKNVIYWKLGLLYEKNDQLDKAKKTYKEALENDQLNGFALNSIENIGSNIDRIKKREGGYLNKNEAIFDLDFLLEVLENVHPNLYHKKDKRKFYKEFEDVKLSIPDSVSFLDFAAISSKLVAEFCDSHTQIQLPLWLFNQKQNYIAFPFDIVFIDNDIFVKDVYKHEHQNLIGREILEINGIEAESIIATMSQFISGKNSNSKFVTISENFKELFIMCFGWKNNYQVILRDLYSKDTYKSHFPGIKFKDISHRRVEEKLDKYHPFSSSYLPDVDAVYIDFQEFSQIQNFETFLDSTFEFIDQNKVENLIIDLRENRGGNTQNGELFFSYFVDKPYMMFSYGKTKYSEKVKNYFNITLKEPNGYIHEQFNKPYFHEVKKNLFKGNIYCLIGNRTNSSAANFAAVIKDFNLGILIGDETGGLASSYGDAIFDELPNSRIGFSVSHKYLVRPSGIESDKGVLPDYVVKQNSYNMINNIDTVLEFAKNIIKNR